jgi:2'-5' RNA ligase
MKRVFLAIDISDEIREAAAARIRELRGRHPETRVSWVRPDNLHITIKFLGETDEGRIAKVKRGMTGVASGLGPFEIGLSGAGQFSGRVLHYNLEDKTGTVRELHKGVEVLASGLGFPPEKRPLQLHLTIARIRDNRNAAELIQSHLKGDAPQCRFTVDRLQLYESRLSPGGSRYTVLEGFPLTGGPEK